MAVPLYTRLWTTDSSGELVSNPTVAMNNIDSTIPEDAQRQWDDELKQNYVEYTDGSNKKQMWIEDIDSLKAKVGVIKENNLAGVASWVKDMETEEFWQMLKQELELD